MNYFLKIWQKNKEEIINFLKEISLYKLEHDISTH